MNSYVDIGGSESLRLKGALLIYEGKGRGFVTWHEAKPCESGGAPYLGEAQNLTTDFVNRLAQGLGTYIPPEVLPENILVRTPEVIVWWTPQTVGAMFFRNEDNLARKLSGKRFSHPALVWKVAGRDLSVRALPDSRRPTASSKLMIAPYWNVDGDSGCVCQGSMRAPGDGGVAAIAVWEKAFFQSEFTHQTGVRRLTSHPEGSLGSGEALREGGVDSRRHFWRRLRSPSRSSYYERGEVASCTF